MLTALRNALSGHFRFTGHGTGTSPFKRQPTSQAMMLDDHKLMYLPIAKNACTSLKQTVASLGGLTFSSDNNIHHTLDSTETGLLLKDRKYHDILHALSDPSWMRFAVIRDPLDRMVSAYVEKFVTTRNSKSRRAECAPVLRHVLNKQSLSAYDYDQGISFRQFASYLLETDPENVNLHWRQQTLQMGHIPLNHLYDFQRLDVLASDLTNRTGHKIDLPMLNVVRNPSTNSNAPEKLADLAAKDLPDPKSIDADTLILGEIRANLTEYFATDITLYNLVQAKHRRLKSD